MQAFHLRISGRRSQRLRFDDGFLSLDREFIHTKSHRSLLVRKVSVGVLTNWQSGILKRFECKLCAKELGDACPHLSRICSAGLFFWNCHTKYFSASSIGARHKLD